MESKAKTPKTYGIIKVRNNAYRIDFRQSCCHKNLCSVRDNTLQTTGESIQNTGCLTVVNTVFVAYLLCYSAHCEDGNSVVGSTDVHQTDEKSYCQLSSPLLLTWRVMIFYEVINAPVLPDYL